ncbi:MAG: tRNA pseudouridine(13) synthase TruD [Candidatus Krumholzibacteria bacterium]|nr:tRNA pseudouridine(13) synthase TruD [Candidatus Krumholzibacteria bacterium]MDP6670107.1 tRNA pseudouridine(13) synthase TruD [Candidatus Krumholzibacteria bacterium]MDP6797556.1 tRNA pseudouridine(13) synthase TruD [Candidatus Krumholzibacteria bacterium]MDP7021231.1 tRNA pseudouridine(13) synthase TruD [Candidatus Krumholzibacteria bacterium]
MKIPDYQELPRRSGEEPLPLHWSPSTDTFRVEEIPLYEASGEGEHLYLEIEKQNLTTGELIRRVAETLGIPESRMGWAGRKDRHATCRQRISLPRKEAEKNLGRLGDDEYQVIEARPHGNKLKTGHLSGNRFTLLLQGEIGDLEHRIRMLEEQGLPNYYGPQRFGRHGDNAARGHSLLLLNRRPRGSRDKLLVHSYQSFLFNRILADRIQALDQLRFGDLAWIHSKGAIFLVEDPEGEMQRARDLEISPSGPMPGRKMRQAEGSVGETERKTLEEGGWEESFSASLTGARRPLRVPVQGLALKGHHLNFSLPPGSYATVLVRELGIQP